MDRANIHQVSEEENEAIAAGDAERYFALLAEDCEMLPPNSAPKRGRELRDWLRKFMAETIVVSLGYEHIETVVTGHWAWHQYQCRWQVTPRAGGQTATPTFNGLHILRRDVDGAWKIVRNIWTVAPA